MENKITKKQIIAKILAWLGLIIITVILCVMAYALMNANGRLALAMIVALVFVSVIYWIGIKIYKDMEEKRMNDLAHMDTKNI